MVDGELNIIFDNCGGQNKNSTVLSLAAWLMALNYFKRVNFIFLVVGHTKNAADRLLVSAHLHVHVNQDGVAKKGATNVTSLIVKTLRQLNLLQDEMVGGELNNLL